METLIYVIIAIFILLYIIDKKEPLPPKINVPVEGPNKRKNTWTMKKKDKGYTKIYLQVLKEIIL